MSCHRMAELCASCIMYGELRGASTRSTARGRTGLGGKGRETGDGVSAQCDGEDSIRKQMSLPKHASCPAYLSARKNAISTSFSLSSSATEGKTDRRAEERKRRREGVKTIFGESKRRFERFDCYRNRRGGGE